MEIGALALLQQAAAEQASTDAGKILLVLSGALAMSVVVERVIEFGKNLVDRLPTRALGNATQPARLLDAELDEIRSRVTAIDDDAAVLKARRVVHDLKKRIEASSEAVERRQLEIKLEGAENDLKAAIKMAETDEREIEEGAPVDTILVQEATDVDLPTAARKLVLQLIALATGIVAAHISDVQLFSALVEPLGVPLNHSLDYVLTGLFIGGGSGPVHTLIRFITERKYTPPPSTVEVVQTQPVAAVEAPAPTITAAPPAPAGVAVITSTAAWAQIRYTGGVDVQKLESTHRRSGLPQKIIYHHTAMHLDSKFEDVVRVIKNRESNGRKWLTGYHCVVTSDGGIHPFCRWDRYGNHAAGHNDRSLGISLNGNFETREVSKWSNYNGAYGPAQPTELQLHAAARVVGLWCALYDITPDFGNTIIPHKQVSPKSCPGNEFPYDEFKHLVLEYVERWKDSADGRHAVEAFATKPYLF